MKFKLIAGKHRSLGRTFAAETKNNIIESDENLAKIFVNKFIRVGDDSEASEGALLKVDRVRRTSEEITRDRVIEKQEATARRTTEGRKLPARDLAGPTGGGLDDEEGEEVDDTAEEHDEEHPEVATKGGHPGGKLVKNLRATAADVVVRKNKEGGKARYNVYPDKTSQEALNDSPLRSSQLDAFLKKQGKTPAKKGHGKKSDESDE